MVAATQVHRHDHDEATDVIDVITGLAKTSTLARLRERALNEDSHYSYNPLASSNTGAIFPDAVSAKVQVESGLRPAPSRFRGKVQIDVDSEDADKFFNRQINPLGWKDALNTAWLQSGNDQVFVGYPNPEVRYGAVTGIWTHDAQDLTTKELSEALSGLPHHDEYLNRLGSLLQGQGLPKSGMTASDRHVKRGGALRADPSFAEEMMRDDERNFRTATRLRVREASDDTRLYAAGPAIAVQKEQEEHNERLRRNNELLAQSAGLTSVFYR